MTSLVRVMIAFWRQHAREALADRPRIMRDAAILAAVVMMCWFSGVFVDGHLEATNAAARGGWFLFALTGVTGMLIVDVTLRAFTRRVTRAQHSGLLEAAVMSRTPLWRILLVMPTFDVAMRYVVCCVLISFGVLAAGVVPVAHFGLAAVVLALGLLTMTAIAMVSASISVVVKYTDPIGLLVALASAICGGVVYPRDVLPPALARMGELLPIGPLVDGLRAATLGDTAGAMDAIVQLTVALAVLSPLAIAMSVYGMRRLLADGALWRRRGPTRVQA